MAFRRILAIGLGLAALIFLVFPTHFAHAKASSPEALYEEARANFETTRREHPDFAKSRKQALRVTRGFERLVNEYPHAPLATDARFMLGRLYQDIYRHSGRAEDREAALLHYRGVWQYDWKNLNADDALYQAASIYWNELRDAPTARLLLEQLLREHPDGDQVTRARILLGTLPGAPAQRLFGIKPESLAIEAQGKSARLTLPLAGSVKVTEKLMHQPDRRLILDLSGAELLGEGLKPLQVRNEALQRVRFGQYSQNTVRLVFEIAERAGYQVERLKSPERLRVTVRSGTAGPAPKVAKSPAKVAVKKEKKAIHLVAIDAGHGGEDPGAIGKKGTREKDVTLQIARKLHRRLSAMPGMQSFLTRDQDVLIPLEQRPQLANERKADLFVSIHCNANPNKKLRGVQTYFLDTIKDDYSRKLAARENDVSLERLSDLELILMDLANRESHERSAKFAGLMQQHLVHGLSRHYPRIEDQGVRTAVFLVLFYAEMPALLIETSFLSNKEEEKRLAADAYQDSMAEAIASGIREYFVQGEKIVGTL